MTTDMDQFLKNHGLAVVHIEALDTLKHRRARALTEAIDAQAWAYQILIDQCCNTAWAERKLQRRNRAKARIHALMDAASPRKA